MNLEALSSHRPVYAFDLLGFGRSSRPPFPSDHQGAEDLFVHSMEKFRQAMGLERFILVGHSLGGYLSASYALRHPERVRHLVMVDPWGVSPREKQRYRELPWLIRTILRLVSFSYPMSAIRAAGPFGHYLVTYYRPALARTFATKLGDESLLHWYIYHCNAQKPSGEVAFSNMSQDLAWARDPMLFRMVALDPDVPVTFVYGARSWINRATGWLLKSLRHGYVDVQIIRGAGHHVYADRWDLFNTLVNAVADSVDRGELPAFNTKLVKRIHAAPTLPQLPIPNPSDLDLQRPLGHGDENVEGNNEEEEEKEVKEEGGGGGGRPVFSLPDSS